MKYPRRINYRDTQNVLGFSLLEVLIFVTILSMFFVTAAAIVTGMVRNLKFEEHKLIATHYGRQLEEWLRSEKEIDWNSFAALAQSSPTRCFYLLNWSSTCDDIDGLYDRRANFSVSGSPITDRVTATITVTWDEVGGVPRSIQTRTEFRILE
ncbi:hypothetical protein HYW87_04550 [Candidatus Roizmanbacteria bacterium]|nr:hypothetical protein [Candidatus Roizmanbacteria bacterium]